LQICVAEVESLAKSDHLSEASRQPFDRQLLGLDAKLARLGSAWLGLAH
jgi:hypothetical protein